MAITAQEVNELRTKTGAGMMDCKKALQEANGDFEAAVAILRKKGQKVSESRQDKQAKEGAIFSYIAENKKVGVMLELNCETDFVARNDDFQQLGNQILEVAAKQLPESVEVLKTLKVENQTVGELLIQMIGKVGEKIDVSKYSLLKGDSVVSYIHPGARVGVLVAFTNVNGADIQAIGKNVAMQVASMKPIALDKDGVDASTMEKEMEIARDLARQEGKPEAMIEKIAQGKLNKFYKENTLLNQDFIKDSSKTIKDYLNQAQKGLTVTAFKRMHLGSED